jgi:hypothetical protein
MQVIVQQMRCIEKKDKQSWLFIEVVIFATNGIINSPFFMQTNKIHFYLFYLTFPLHRDQFFHKWRHIIKLRFWHMLRCGSIYFKSHLWTDFPTGCPRLIWSRIVESVAYCNQKLLVQVYLNSKENTSVNWIIRLYWYHFYGGPKWRRTLYMNRQFVYHIMLLGVQCWEPLDLNISFSLLILLSPNSDN